MPRTSTFLSRGCLNVRRCWQLWFAPEPETAPSHLRRSSAAASPGSPTSTSGPPNPSRLLVSAGPQATTSSARCSFGGAPLQSGDGTGRIARIAPGDLVLGALGVRAATLEAVGDWHEVGSDG